MKTPQRLALGLFILTTFCASAEARGPLLATRLVTQWGGPETRMRCTDTKSMTGVACGGFMGLECHPTTWSTCSAWATDFQQHKLIARMYGPDDITNADDQLKDISNSCLASGVILAAVPAVVGAAIDVSADAIKSGVETCLRVQNVLSQIVAPGFEVTVDREEDW